MRIALTQKEFLAGLKTEMARFEVELRTFLLDQNSVFSAMNNGEIVKPTWDQILKLYPVEESV